jgi:hypothetical protein
MKTVKKTIREIVQFSAGEHIEKCINQLIDKWNYISEKKVYGNATFITEGTFNEIQLIYTGKETAEGILKAFHDQADQNIREYESSPEYKKQEIDRKNKIKRMQEKIDNLMSYHLPDWKDYDKVLDFILEYFELSEHSGVVNYDEMIIRYLETNGYESGCNTGKDYKAGDKENTARYIIGQFMDSIKTHGMCPPVITSFYEKYKKDFPDKVLAVK